MVDNGTSISLFDSTTFSPAGGNAGTTTINDSLSSTGQQLEYAIDLFSDLGNTIFFPGSTYDALVEPALNFYKLRGYYTAGSIFETWVTNDPSGSPPSGHFLINISIVDSWTV